MVCACVDSTERPNDATRQRIGPVILLTPEIKYRRATFRNGDGSGGEGPPFPLRGLNRSLEWTDATVEGDDEDVAFFAAVE